MPLSRRISHCRLAVPCFAAALLFFPLNPAPGSLGVCSATASTSASAAWSVATCPKSAMTGCQQYLMNTGLQLHWAGGVGGLGVDIAPGQLALHRQCSGKHSCLARLSCQAVWFEHIHVPDIAACVTGDMAIVTRYQHQINARHADKSLQSSLTGSLIGGLTLRLTNGLKR